jgi:hypothetical protein
LKAYDWADISVFRYAGFNPWPPSMDKSPLAEIPNTVRPTTMENHYWTRRTTTNHREGLFQDVHFQKAVHKTLRKNSTRSSDVGRKELAQGEVLEEKELRLVM